MKARIKKTGEILNVASYAAITVDKCDDWCNPVEYPVNVSIHAPTRGATPSSKMCTCGYVNKELKLSQREWTCPNCGQINDRDLLAAINIKRFGLQEQNLIGYSPAVRGVEGAEWSALAGTVKRQYINV